MAVAVLPLEEDKVVVCTEAAGHSKRSVTPSSNEDGSASFVDWPLVVDASTPLLQDVNGFSLDAIEALRKDGHDAVPCAVLEPRRTKGGTIDFVVAFASQSLSELLGRSPSSLTSSTGLDFLQLQPASLDELHNKKAWSKLEDLLDTFQQSAGMTPPGPLRQLFLMPTASGPRWCVLESICVVTNTDSDEGGRYTLHVLHILEAPVPKALWGPAALDREESTRMFIRGLHKQIAAKVVIPANGCGPITDVLQTTTAVLSRVLQDSEVGDLFVPRFGQESAEVFARQGTARSAVEKVEDKLLTLFEMPKEEVTRLSMDKDTASNFSCALALAYEVDCPLVHVSHGFEKLTGYSRSWAIGRNCRFMQPRSSDRNEAFNLAQLPRMKEFCRTARGSLLTVLLQEKADGTSFWNLLLLEHVEIKGIHYYFSVQTCLEMEQGILDRIVGQVWTEDGAVALEWLRTILSRKEASLGLQRRPMRRVVLDAFQEWLVQAGSEMPDWWRGYLFIPKVGQLALKEFVGQWPHAAREVPESIAVWVREYTKTVNKAMDEGKVCWSLADPEFVDCPLVCVNGAFEACTGYNTDSVLGRNLRLLQPSLKSLNETLNGEEVKYIQEFMQQRPVTKPSTFALVISERRKGEHFWNLMYMRHVDLNGRHYVLSLHMPLGVSLPTVIQTQEAASSVYDYDQKGWRTVVGALGLHLVMLREELHQITRDSLEKADTRATASLVAWMKASCTEYEGDHRVPRIGCRDREIFESDQTWKHILQSVEPSIMQVCGVSMANGQTSSPNVACAVADASNPEATLVYISKEFETLTGYPREWAIGRNCRFLQPNIASVNALLNEPELVIIRNFVSGGVFPSRVFNLLVNESHDDQPFWNLLFMEFIEANGLPHIFGLQSNLEHDLQSLGELLAMDDVAMTELAKLRKMLHGLEASIGQKKVPFRDMARECVSKWAAQLPALLRGPRLADKETPVINLEISGRIEFQPTLTEALRDGVRHFFITFLSGDRPQNDKRMALLEGRLCALRLAEALNTLKTCHLHYLRTAVSFTLVTPPVMITAFAEVNKAITSSGYACDSWLLDVRGSPAGKVQEAWQVMSRTKRNKEVRKIGFWGATKQIIEAIPKDAEKPSLCAVENYAGKEGDPAHYHSMEYMQRLGIPLLAYHVCGPKNFLLESEQVQMEASHVGADTTILAIKWAEAKGFGSVVPRLRSEAFSRYSSEAAPASRYSSEAAPAGNRSSSKAVPDDAASDFSDVASAAAAAEEPDQAAGGDECKDVVAMVGMHRNFIREYLKAPKAEMCAAILKAIVASYNEERPMWAGAAPRCASRKTSTTSTLEARAGSNPAMVARTASEYQGPTRRHTVGNMVAIMEAAAAHASNEDSVAPASARRHSSNTMGSSVATAAAPPSRSATKGTAQRPPTRSMTKGSTFAVEAPVARSATLPAPRKRQSAGTAGSLVAVAEAVAARVANTAEPEQAVPQPPPRSPQPPPRRYPSILDNMVTTDEPIAPPRDEPIAPLRVAMGLGRVPAPEAETMHIKAPLKRRITIPGVKLGEAEEIPLVPTPPSSSSPRGFGGATQNRPSDGESPASASWTPRSAGSGRFAGQVRPFLQPQAAPPKRPLLPALSKPGGGAAGGAPAELRDPASPPAAADAAAAGLGVPDGLEMIQRAAVKLQSQGWSMQDIAAVFEVPPKTIAAAMGA